MVGPASRKSGFTIVELLIVIVIIGILAAITIVSYTGITARANTATLQSDLANAKKQIALYYADHGVYPKSLGANNCLSNDTLTPQTDTNYCLKPSSGNSFNTNLGNGTTYTLTATRGTVSYTTTENTAPQQALTNCPTGFVLVPGSATYGTSNFCVMKYEAKADDNGDGIGDTNHTTVNDTWPADTYPISASRKLVSTPGGYSIVNISQTTAITAAQNYTKDCTGCHLISEAEWMTIAQNVLGVNSNWSSGTVGSGFIYSGHNDGTPGAALVAVANDNDGYNGTGQTTGSNQRRTLTLSNGNVIWDMAGNIYELTSGQATGSQPGVIGDGFTWREYTALTSSGSLSINVLPSGTGISGASSWAGLNGIGHIYSSSDDSVLRVFRRGGYWSYPSGAGILCMGINYAPNYIDTTIGFRVAAPAF